MNPLTNHLDDVGETYTEHLTHALGFAVAMILGGLACFLHAVVPFLFVTTGSDCIRRLHERMVVDRRTLSAAARPVVAD